MSKKIFAALSMSLFLAACNTTADVTTDEEVMVDDETTVEDTMMDDTTDADDEAMMEASSSSSVEAMDVEGTVDAEVIAE